MTSTPALELGIVTDEIALNFHDAVQHGESWGIRRYEIRCLPSGRVPHVDEREIDEVDRLRRDRDLRITALSPGMFKGSLSRPSDSEREISEVLPKTIDLCHRLMCPLIIVFGFLREKGEPSSNRERAVEFFQRAALIAQSSGLLLAIENEPGFWCDTGANTRSIITDVGSPALGANWDPCNAFGTDEIPYPDGYEAIKPVIKNVHAKDTARGSLIQCVPIGDGVIDWAGQIRALVRDRLVPHVTIETHCHPLIESSQRNVETLRQMIDQS